MTTKSISSFPDASSVKDYAVTPMKWAGQVSLNLGTNLVGPFCAELPSGSWQGDSLTCDHEDKPTASALFSTKFA